MLILIFSIAVLGGFHKIGFAGKEETASQKELENLQRQIKELNQRLYNNQRTLELLQKNNKRKDEEVQQNKQESKSNDELKNKIKDLEKTIQDLEGQAAQQSSLNRQKVTEFEAYQTKLTAAESIIQEKIQSSTNLTAENTLLKEKLNQANQMNTVLNGNISKLNEKIKSQESAALKGAEAKTFALENDIVSLKEKLAALQKELLEKESTSLWLIKKREELTQEMAKQHELQKQLNNKITQSVSDSSKLKELYEKQIADLHQDYKNQLTVLNNQVINLTSQLTVTKTSSQEAIQTAVQHSTSSCREQIQQSENLINEQKQSIAEYKKNLESLDLKLQKSTRDKEDLDKQLLELGQQYSDLEGSLEDKIASVKNPLESRITVLETQLAESRKSIGDKINSEKAPLEEINKNFKAQLSSKDKTLAEKDIELKKKNDFEAQLQKQINLMEVKNTALENEIIQLNEEISKTSNSCQSQASQTNESLKDKITLLEKIVSNHKNELHEKETTIASQNQERIKTNRTVLVLEAENDTLKKDLDQISAEMEKINNVTLQRNELLQAPFKKEIEEANKKYALLEQQYKNTKNMLDQLTKEKENLFYSLNKSEKEKESLIEEINNLQTKIKQISSLPPQNIKPYKR